MVFTLTQIPAFPLEAIHAAEGKFITEPGSIRFVFCVAFRAVPAQMRCVGICEWKAAISHFFSSRFCFFSSSSLCKRRALSRSSGANLSTYSRICCCSRSSSSSSASVIVPWMRLSINSQRRAFFLSVHVSCVLRFSFVVSDDGVMVAAELLSPVLFEAFLLAFFCVSNVASLLAKSVIINSFIDTPLRLAYSFN